MAAYCSCRDTFPPGPSSRLRQGLCTRAFFLVSHLGSVMPAVCLTRPQYVLRSYCDSGSSRLPGREADMLAGYSEQVFLLFLFFPLLWDVARAGLSSCGEMADEGGSECGV